jgi:hypothetical protein
MMFRALYTDLLRNGTNLSSKSLSFEISLGLLRSSGANVGFISILKVGFETKSPSLLI